MPNVQPSGDECPPRLPEELIGYLKMIRDNPGVPATERDKKHGIGLKKGSQLRKRLKEVGLIEEYNENPGGHGRNFKDVRVSESGFSFLRKLDDREKLM